MNGGRGGGECAKTGETPIFNQITHNLIPLERKSGHKKCKPLKKGLQIFLPVLGRVFEGSGAAGGLENAAVQRRSNGVQTNQQNALKMAAQRSKTKG